ncbi:MAG: hypothetical protein JW936_06125 [Sedimentisphaerales bacterium]|nr:hypothetical protein [Sedimentisphaerales bacterium]
MPNNLTQPNNDKKQPEAPNNAPIVTCIQNQAEFQRTDDNTEIQHMEFSTIAQDGTISAKITVNISYQTNNKE